jgi:hypothetical protein
MDGLCCVIDWVGRLDTRPLVEAAMRDMLHTSSLQPKIILNEPGICIGGVCLAGAREEGPSSMPRVAVHGMLCGSPPDAKDAKTLFAQFTNDPPDGLCNILAWQQDERALYVCSDVLAARPLYYWATDSMLVLASELKTFRLMPGFSGRPNPHAIAAIMAIEHTVDADTILDSVHVLPVEIGRAHV